MVYMDYTKFGKEYHKNYYYHRRQQIFEYLGGECKSCGSKENLHVDHIDPNNKEFDISRKLSVRRNKDELDKCQLLCRDCHIEKTRIENSGWTHGTMYGWMKKKCCCEICTTAKNIHNNKRNIARRKR